VSYNLKGIGIDAISVDSIDSKKMENHQAILANEIFIIENLTNLCKLTSEYFLFTCFPIKFQNSDGSPIRAIAIYS
jgi:kynurenine formamidase